MPRMTTLARITITTNVIKNAMTPPEPISCNSNPWSFGSGPEACPCCLVSAMYRFQYFLGLNVVSRQQRPRCQIAAEECQPQSADGDHDYDIQPGQSKSFRIIRLDHEIQVYPTHAHDPGRQQREFRDIPFQWTRQQQGKRNSELEHNQKQANVLPAAMKTPEVIDDFLRQVPGPHDEQLREREICPHHHESQRPLAVIVNKIRLKHSGHGLVTRKNALDHNAKSHGRHDFADQNN